MPNSPASAEERFFHSVVVLQATIIRFIKEYNEEPKPFIRSADPDDIIAAVRHGHTALQSNHQKPARPWGLL